MKGIYYACSLIDTCIVKPGRYELDDTKISCDECDTYLLLNRFWPGSLERYSQYLFDTDVFYFFDLLQKFNPGLSTAGFLHSLEQFSAMKGRVRVLICSVCTIRNI